MPPHFCLSAAPGCVIRMLQAIAPCPFAPLEHVFWVTFRGDLIVLVGKVREAHSQALRALQNLNLLLLWTTISLWLLFPADPFIPLLVSLWKQQA